MKQTRNFRRLMSFLLIVTMLLSVAVVGIAGVSAAQELALNYSYKYMNAGYAEGRIDLTGSADDYGTYYLYWADDTKALDGYAEIAAVNLNSSRKSVNLAEFTAIPADATKLIAIKSNSAPATKTVASAAAVYDIPEAKQFKHSSSDVEYNFMALSDVHIDSGGFYKYAEQNFKTALNSAAERDAEFVTIAGDLMNGNNGANNYEKEWLMYLKAIADSNFTGPVYEVNGNHETYNNGGNANDPYAFGLNLYNIATGLGIDTEKVPAESYYEVTGPNGDHFIFMAMEYITKTESPNVSNTFTNEQMDWLEGLLNKYKGDGKKIFINEHAPFGGYGAGDNKVTPHYAAAMTIDEQYPNVVRFKELLEANKNIIWFNGHTHIDFKYNYNIDNENGTTAYTVHVPSTASPTQVNAGGTLDYPQSPETSQGYFADVFADAVVLNGSDLIKNEVLPLYTYLVDYTGEEVTANPEYKELEDLYEKITVTVNATAVVENPAKVQVSLYGADDPTATAVVDAVKNEDGTYSAEASTMYSKMKFIVNNGANDIKSAEYNVTADTVVLGAYKIKYTNDKSWSNVNIYAWSNVGGDVVTWPGMAMTKEADGTYTAIIPDYPDMVIFNNGDGGAQTDDLSITPYIIGTEQPTQPTTPPDVTSYIYGDADMNGKVNIKDATTVQKYAADMIELEDVAFIQANVTGDKAVNVRDCTAIQKFIAGIITSFAVEGKKDVAEVSAASGDEQETPDPIVPVGSISDTIAAVKKTLADEYYYASYVAYASLKKAYFACKDKDASAVSAEDAAALNKALADYNEMKNNNPSHIGTSGGNSGAVPTPDGKYYIYGSFNDWQNNTVAMTKGSDGVYTYSHELNAGTHEFKFYDGTTWYGNGGTMKDGDSGWTFRSTEQSNCKLEITEKGTYQFTFSLVQDNGETKVKIGVSKQ